MEKYTKRLIDLGNKLREMGFVLSWENPFFSWSHGAEIVPFDGNVTQDDTLSRLYVVDPPVPKLTPFDIATVSLSASNRDLRFELSLYYSSMIEEIIEAEEYNDICLKHDAEWAPLVCEHMMPVMERFSLSIDVEYDVFIEWCLYKTLRNKEWDQVIDIMTCLKELDRTADVDNGQR